LRVLPGNYLKGSSVENNLNVDQPSFALRSGYVVEQRDRGYYPATCSAIAVSAAQLALRGLATERLLR